MCSMSDPKDESWLPYSSLFIQASQASFRETFGSYLATTLPFSHTARILASANVISDAPHGLRKTFWGSLDEGPREKFYHSSLNTNGSGAGIPDARATAHPLPSMENRPSPPFGWNVRREGQAKEGQQDPRPLLDHVGHREDDNRGDACPTATL